MRSNFGLAVAMPLLLLGATEAAAMESGPNGPSGPGYLAELSAAGSATTALETAALAEQSNGAGDSGWEVSVTPYLWMAGLNVDIDTPQGESIEVDESFTDILGNLKFAFMGALEVRHDRLVFLNDVIFLSIGSEAKGTLGPGIIEADTDIKTWISTHLAGYRVVDQGPMFVDILAGARIASIDVEVDLTGPLQTIERDSSETKIGPVIASRAHVPLGERWAMGLYGDLGGFGVTADLSWQLMGTVQYSLSDHWRLAAGWRHVSVHQDKNDFDVKLKMSGPILGFSYRF